MATQRRLSIKVADMRIAQQFKQSVTVSRQNPRDRSQLTVVAENVEMVIFPQLAQNQRPDPESELLGTGQLILEGDYLAHPLVPSDDYKEGDVVDSTSLGRLFVWDAQRVKSIEPEPLTDVQWLILGLEPK